MKKLVSIAIIVLVSISMVFAANEWWQGQEISRFEYSGLQNVSASDIDSALYTYRHKEFTNELLTEIENTLYQVEGIDFVIVDADQDQFNLTGKLVLNLEFYELPMLSSISFEGNEKVKTSDLRESFATLVAGSYYDSSRKSLFQSAKQEVLDYYANKGFESVEVSYTLNEDTENNTFSIVFSISEGLQTRIISIGFSGNEKIDSSVLKKQVSSKVKSLFNNGFLNEETLQEDVSAIVSYYQTNGYIEVIVGEPVIEELEPSTDKYRDVNVTIPISEGSQWFYGGLEVTGNTLFSDEEIAAVLTMEVGSVLNLQKVQEEYTAVADLYYNSGYISNGMNITSEPDDTTMQVKYYLTIAEGSRAYVENVLITGLTKTKDYVMTRELTLNAGDVFSKEKLITSAQNLYNTGLLSSIDYELLYGSEDPNNVIIEFKVEEGNQKDIQFGATFGGTVDGFPVSGFLSWTDNNLGGRGQSLSVSTTISPDTQSLSFSFGDSWFKGKRWSNSLSFSFSHKKVEDELTRANTTVPYYDGRNSNETYPAGFDSAEEWNASGNAYPSSKYLMDYHLYSFSLGYSTGYTFIYDFGRLTFSGGVSVSLNKAIYDNTLYDPFEKLTYQYGQKWQFSNKFTFSLQWDGRDYVTNTTKGYVLSAGMTYAGGILGGLSNYIKLTTSAAGYLKLFSFTTKDDTTKNIMLCASSSASVMLPQLYNYEGKGIKFWDAVLGATKYEMLYIDGMTIGRGFNTIADQAFLWDNMLEISYPLAENVIQAEAFISATGINASLENLKAGLNWYFAAGAGIKLKISGFPLGLYLVKNATYTMDSTGASTFNWIGGSYFHGKSASSGMSLVLAISTSLI